MLPDAGGGLNALVGGWTLNGGFHYNSGNPLRITSTNWYPGMNNVYPKHRSGLQPPQRKLQRPDWQHVLQSGVFR
jgi:hypothetical protein